MFYSSSVDVDDNQPDDDVRLPGSPETTQCQLTSLQIVNYPAPRHLVTPVTGCHYPVSRGKEASQLSLI